MYEALQQIHVCKQDITGLTETLTSMSVALEEEKEQIASLDANIRVMKITSAMCVDSHGGHLEFDLVSMKMLPKAYSNFESRTA
jgi:actin-like ATPase involved in cell morphogenesis